ENKAKPLSATRAITWLFRSMDQSLRARQARKAWAQGIILEPGKPAASAICSVSKRANSGRNRKRPPQLVKNRRGGQGEISHIGDVLDRGAGALRPLLVQTPWQRSKALGFEDFAHRRGAQRELSLLEDFA